MADFATVAELETFLGTSGLGSRGTAMLGHASNAIRLYTGQDLSVVVGRQESYAGDAWATFIQLTQTPVTAVSAITIDGVAFTAFEWNRWGLVNRVDYAPWDTGPILVTYDSGFDASSDEMLGIKAVCLEVAARALTGNPETFGLEITELRGPSPAVFLTQEEKMFLDRFGTVAMA